MTWICNAYIIVKFRRFRHAIMFGMSFDFNNYIYNCTKNVLKTQTKD